MIAMSISAAKAFDNHSTLEGQNPRHDIELQRAQAASPQLQTCAPGSCARILSHVGRPLCVRFLGVTCFLHGCYCHLTGLGRIGQAFPKGETGTCPLS